MNIETSSNLKYPRAKRMPDTDTSCSLTVDDPYQWMEKANSETAAFDQEQTILSGEYLAAWPYRSQLRKQLTRIAEHISSGDTPAWEEASSPPVFQGSLVYYMGRERGHDHPCLLVTDRNNDTT